ncbi:hypothetical protein H2248_001769 [Termitomyces sp. 'cryptogamus']|nr:hypothetical protein H2248_001769 [Termitomyces sp. 'cryptogamus']
MSNDSSIRILTLTNLTQIATATEPTCDEDIEDSDDDSDDFATGNPPRVPARTSTMTEEADTAASPSTVVGSAAPGSIDNVVEIRTVEPQSAVF